MPVERRTVSANVRAAPSSMSISSYSHTPSCAAVSRPAVTNRWAGAVGSPNSLAHPSASVPGDNGERTLRVRLGRWSGRGDARGGGGPAGVHEAVVTRTAPSSARIPRPSPPRPGARPPAPGTSRRRGRARRRSRRSVPGPAPVRVADLHLHRLWRVDERVLPGRRVVVGVAEVAAVDQPPVAGEAVEREGAAGPVDLDADEPVGEDDGLVGRVQASTAWASGAGVKALQPYPAPRRCGRRCVGSRAGPWRPERARRAGRRASCRRPAWPRRSARSVLFGADRDRHVDALVGLDDLDVLDPGVVADFRALEHAEDGADRVRVEHHRARQPGALREHLHALGRRTVGRHDQLDEAGAGPGRGVQHRGARLGQRVGEVLDRTLGQTRGDGPCLGVAVEDGVDDVVDRAGADGVVRGVADDLFPRQLEETGGIGVGGLEERGTAARRGARARARPARPGA